jgi:hypothetical protein
VKGRWVAGSVLFGLDRDLDQSLAVRSLHCLLDGDHPLRDIDLLPAESRRLPDLETGRDEEDPQGREAILRGHDKVLLDLTRGEGDRAHAAPVEA